MAKKRYTVGVATVKLSVVYKGIKVKRTVSEKIGFIANDFSAKDKEELGNVLQSSYRQDLERSDEFEKITVTVTFETLKCDKIL
ncbi:MAG: hypothetical protein IJB60_08185 [Bacteroidaceae bacterium]|nr:hypothetical protein [Bacteroidaceae bacterium]